MCVKELYQAKYDPLSVSYTVLSGEDAFRNSSFSKRTVLLNPRTYTQIHTPNEVQVGGGGGGVDGGWNPSPEFLICAVF